MIGTRKQMEALAAIESLTRKNGVAPTYDDIREAVGLKSKSGISRLIVGLEERGLIRRIPGRARAIEVVPAAERMPPSSIKAQGKIADADALSAVLRPQQFAWLCVEAKARGTLPASLLRELLDDDFMRAYSGG